ncbi:MAG: PQQ-binding-like beta-propeller repeat protein, partial [Planctomycetales bacterium]|nr:PQQ-binding-like beta-propeller repeat protein [Planctomycetales bacterium]NIM08141.1 PQQ-binding-like beta-propeller repeat protein [Planctomycetales bacterium]NIN07634.1 PQQ-binding-like beta-propeller repeat protein [Planctomycetales bacterium]NIN76751.1 PQQ-binding-like beta-propeller repeat protein [Planctomycetales bacterium]NIO33960.1 PQQ-binding-like beta-propeller repeat protein [Planctomycetales bacterium]
MQNFRSTGVLALILLTVPARGADAEEGVEDLRTRTDGVDWPGFLGPTGDSKSPERGILTRWPTTGPKLVWQRRLGEGYAMPSVSRGRLFLFDRVKDDARLVCLQSETGRLLWEFRYKTDYEDLYGYSNGPRCCPVVDHQRVYLYGAEGMLHCLRVTDGKMLWKVDTMATFGVVQNFFGVGSTPVVQGDQLIVQVGGSPPAARNIPPGRLNEVTSNGTAIVAFDKRTGQVRYRAGQELASYASPVLATIDRRDWCFLFARGGLLVLNPADGRVDFHYPWRSRKLESVNASNPVVVGNEVFISETYGPGSSLLAVGKSGWEVVWRDDPQRRGKAMQTHWNTPIHVEGYLYGSSGRHTQTAELRCIAWKTGEIQWSVPGLQRCSLMYVDGHFVCLSEYGKLRLVRANPQRYELVAETTFSEADPN